MRISIETPAGSKKINYITQQIKINSPLSRLEIEVGYDELCKLQIDKEDNHFIDEGLNCFGITPGKNNHQRFKITNSEGKFNLNFSYNNVLPFEDSTIENLLRFQNDLRNLSLDTNNK